MQERHLAATVKIGLAGANAGVYAGVSILAGINWPFTIAVVAFCGSLVGFSLCGMNEPPYEN